MFPLIFVIIVNLFIAFAHEISKPLKTILTQPSAEEKELRSKIATLQKELQEISINDNYTDWVKKQRQISALERQQPPLLSEQTIKNGIINYGLGYILQCLGSFVLIFISLYYRYTPVIVFDEKFNFSPFGNMIGFPTGINNGISVPFWIFVTNFSFRCLANLFRA